jgi:exosome complex component RRP4
MASHSVPLTDTILLEAYDWTMEQEGGANDLLQEDFGAALVAAVGGK